MQWLPPHDDAPQAEPVTSIDFGMLRALANARQAGGATVRAMAGLAKDADRPAQDDGQPTDKTGLAATFRRLTAGGAPSAPARGEAVPRSAKSHG